ncbi:MAG TPA: hypothetical protein VFN64_04845 [Burkholderiaceae bacterium]|nr:hypothetical protein [Burkholderiaceae bacterium]
MFNKKELATLQKVAQVLGPVAVCECAGCAWETNEALRLLTEIGIHYDYRTGPAEGRPAHDPAAEQKGNERTRRKNDEEPRS